MTGLKSKIDEQSNKIKKRLSPVAGIVPLVLVDGMQLQPCHVLVPGLVWQRQVQWLGHQLLQPLRSLSKLAGGESCNTDGKSVTQSIINPAAGSAQRC